MLPVTAAGYAGSPYDARSACAGEPALVALEPLVRDGLLPDRENPGKGRRSANLDTARARKLASLRRAWETFRKAGHPEIAETLEGARPPWLDAWALFSALEERFDGAPWWTWDGPLRRAEEDALRRARRELAAEIDFHAFVQSVFAWQWGELRADAAERGVLLYGDVPIYVSRNSADVWFHRELFDVAEDGTMRATSGVPPDYFSETGQSWGTPVFRWDRHREEGFSWWTERMGVALRRFDRVRIDHFRGLVAYWRIPAEASGARGGEWIEGPGIDLFREMHDRLGPLALVAENLGVITEDVEGLRREIGAPGMRVLQFGFDSPDSGHLPHHHERDEVIFTGTHDNAPTRTWYRSLSPDAKSRFQAYAGTGGPAHRRLARLALTSVADLALLPLQDVLGLGARSRTNTPGTTNGNWTWRLDGSEPLDEAGEWLAGLVEVTGR